MVQCFSALAPIFVDDEKGGSIGEVCIINQPITADGHPSLYAGGLGEDIVDFSGDGYGARLRSPFRQAGEDDRIALVFDGQEPRRMLGIAHTGQYNDDQKQQTHGFRPSHHPCDQADIGPFHKSIQPVKCLEKAVFALSGVGGS